MSFHDGTTRRNYRAYAQPTDDPESTDEFTPASIPAATLHPDASPAQLAIITHLERIDSRSSKLERSVARVDKNVAIWGERTHELAVRVAENSDQLKKYEHKTRFLPFINVGIIGAVTAAGVALWSFCKSGKC